jgi:hypothetical protein
MLGIWMTPEATFRTRKQNGACNSSRELLALYWKALFHVDC